VILFEDEHLLVVNKPPGINTHAPSPFAGEGLYEWLKNSLPSRSRLAIIHRLDKETSGVIAFGKTPAANRSLTQQFERREVRKKYVLLTDRSVSPSHFTAKSWLKRAGEKYVNHSNGTDSELAITEFNRITAADPPAAENKSHVAWEARPQTGRTHQIRAHAAVHGIPILGDTLYGGSPAQRIYLHAAQLTFRHPVTNKELLFETPPDFSADPRWTLRAGFIGSATTDAFRLTHGAADGWPGLYVDRLGDFLLAQSATDLTDVQRAFVESLCSRFSLRGIYYKTLRRQIQHPGADVNSPRWLSGDAAPAEILIEENRLRYSLRFDEGYSVGLFLDQRENRRRLQTGYIAPDFNLGAQAEVLNAFSYTCGFSVAAAAAGARVTSLDLSKGYLEWGRKNFVLNEFDPSAHDFIFGDAFAWFRRLAKKNRLFDVIILDPPTFSRSKEHGVFQVEKDYQTLVEAALPLLKREGVLLASANTANLKAELFLEKVTRAVTQSGRTILQQHYAPQPPDFPIHREEPAYLKTVWLRLGT
jgi:23S rRNA (cytosine1962-C5)-methyltransferase